MNGDGYSEALVFCLTICDRGERALDSRSKGLGFDSHCWLCVEVSGKLFIPCCLCPPRNDGYLVER